MAEKENWIWVEVFNQLILSSQSFFAPYDDDGGDDDYDNDEQLIEYFFVFQIPKFKLQIIFFWVWCSILPFHCGLQQFTSEERTTGKFFF